MKPIINTVTNLNDRLSIRLTLKNSALGNG